LHVLPRVAIIVLNWNRAADTLECIDSLQRVTYQNFRLIVVDNGSTDDSVDTLSRKYPELTLLKVGSNLGYAGGNNAGTRLAVESFNPDYVLILNNDTVVEPDFLTALVECARSDSALGLLQPKLLHYGSSTINSMGGDCDIFGATSLRGARDQNSDQYDPLTTRGCFYVSGACLLVTRKLLETIGEELFDSLLFAFHEDVDLSWHARLLGFELAYCPDSECLHKGGRTTGGFNPRTAYWANRNRIRILLKNYSLGALLITLPLAICIEFFASVMTSRIHKDPRYFSGFWRGLLWNSENLGSTLQLRRRVQFERRVPDKEIIATMKFSSLELSFLVHRIRGGKSVRDN